MTPEGQGEWVLERSQDQRFPYRMRIVWRGAPLLTLRAQDRWPETGRHIFCLRETEPPEPGETLEEVERVPIVALQRQGPRLSVVLGRKRHKRCDFLFLYRSYKTRPGESYEQIFWQTEKSLRQRRPAFKLSLRHSPAGMAVRVDSRERYPWRFPGARTERGALPVGDYALVEGSHILAVVERKTLDNLLGDFGAMPALHQQLVELATYEHHALVVEAPYEDFLKPERVHHYTAGFRARAIAEFYVLHTGLRIVFCANRKAANEWTRHYFAAICGERTEKEQRLPEAA